MSSVLSPLHPPAYHQGKKHQKQGKTGQKLDFIWCGLVFSREFGRPKRAKVNIYLGFVAFGASVVALLLGRWSRPPGAGGAGLRGFRTCRRWRLSSRCVPSLLSPLLHLLSCNSPILCLISRFKGVFSVVWAFGVGLYGFGALRGLWGFCTRE